MASIIHDSSNDLVKANDFNELKGIVRDLALSLQTLTGEVQAVKKQVGGLSMAVGYGLEDQVVPYLKDFAEKEYKMTVEQVIGRENVVYEDGRFDEVNLFVKGKRNDRPFYLVGESKAQPGKRDLVRFSSLLERLRVHFSATIEGFMVGYGYDPETRQYAQDQHPSMRLVKSYEFELLYDRVR